MATTKRKRRPTKHRGNAAGMVEARGRTGRKPTAEEQRAGSKAMARASRLDRPPTWGGAVQKAAIAAVVFGVAVTLLFKRPVAGAALLALFTFVIYVPLSFYTDQFVHKRAQARKAKA